MSLVSVVGRVYYYVDIVVNVSGESLLSVSMGGELREMMW